MANKVSVHVKPCNIGQSEAHNKRLKEYMSHINQKDIYVRQDLISLNESWIDPAIDGLSLQEYHDIIAKMVKEKTGRALQTKERSVKDKKTGKTKTVQGSSPIRESVLVCKDTTTMSDVLRFAQESECRFGIKAIQIYIHRDEGHYEYPGDKESWKPNHHVHIVWDWMDHNTGKSIKLNKADTSAMQDMAAEILEMERGQKKEETGREHLERNDYILAEQARKSESLNLQIAEKQEKYDRLDKENTDSIKSGIANFFGKGKYAELEKRNKELEESVPKEKERLQILFDKQLTEAIKKETQVFQKEKAKSQAELQTYKEECSSLAYQLHQAKSANSHKITDLENKIKWRNELLLSLGDLWYKTSELFKKAIDAIIDFARSCFGGNGHHGNIFYNDEVVAIKTIMDEYSKDTEGRLGVGNWLSIYAEQKGNLNEREFDKAAKEVDDVAEGRYDWRISRGGNNLSK